MKPLLNRKNVLISILTVFLIGVAAFLFMYYQPHRNVQSAKTDFSYNAADIVNEYLQNPDMANQKYLDEQGESKIIEVSGVIGELQDNFNGNLVVLLTDAKAPAGVSCTFLSQSSTRKEDLKVGERVTIKGVIRSGASFDADLEMYEHVVLEECDLKK